jgi:hypothetical protein
MVYYRVKLCLMHWYATSISFASYAHAICVCMSHRMYKVDVMLAEESKKDSEKRKHRSAMVDRKPESHAYQPTVGSPPTFIAIWCM